MECIRAMTPEEFGTGCNVFPHRGSGKGDQYAFENRKNRIISF
jgi:hypothetical protein